MFIAFSQARTKAFAENGRRRVIFSCPQGTTTTASTVCGETAHRPLFICLRFKRSLITLQKVLPRRRDMARRIAGGVVWCGVV